MSKNIFCAVVLCFLTTKAVYALAVDDYKYLTYEEANDKMEQLAKNYPNYVKLHDAGQENSNIGTVYCGNGIRCKHYYLEVSDFTQSEEKIHSLPQVFLMGAVHGDERLGPNIILYLVDYLLENHGKNTLAGHLLKDRLFVLLPITNTNGYQGQRRNETQPDSNETTYDPNRDFAYNVKPEECMLTTAARVVNHIYKSFLIRSAITFHGGEHSITYPWGGKNHKDDKIAHESPDDVAFRQVVDVLVKEGSADSQKSIPKYNYGRMTDIVYDVNGGMEDWSYAASWEKGVIPKCTPINLGGNYSAEQTTYDEQQLRSFTYLIETDDDKNPSAKALGNPKGINDPTPSQDGHIPRNIRIALALADLTEQNIRINKMRLNSKNKVEVKWQGGGCINVDSTALSYRYRSGDDTEYGEWKKTSEQSGKGYWSNKSHTYNETLDWPENASELEVHFEMSCDKVWKNQLDPNPNMTAQTHFVKSRTEEYYSVKSGKYFIQTAKKKTLNFTGLTRDSLSTQILQPYKLSINLTQCTKHNIKHIGLLTASITEEDSKPVLKFNGELNLSGGTYYEAHFYQYGDTSYCGEFLGSPFNPVTGDILQKGNLRGLSTNLSYAFSIETGTKVTSTNVSATYSLDDEESLSLFVGRAIGIRVKGSRDIAFYGAIEIDQNNACKEGSGECESLSLEDAKGVCVVHRNSSDGLADTKAKVTFSSSYDKNTTINSQIFDENIKKLYITGHDTNLTLDISPSSTVYHMANPLKSDLDRESLLGRVFTLQAVDGAEKVTTIGTCSVMLSAPSRSETAFLLANYGRYSQDIWASIMVIILAVLITAVITAVVIFLIFKVKTSEPTPVESAEIEFSHNDDIRIETRESDNLTPGLINDFKKEEKKIMLAEMA